MTIDAKTDHVKPFPSAMSLEPLEDLLTRHARSRLGSRGISEIAVVFAITLGRIVRTRGAEIHVIGRKEVQRFAAEGLDLSEFEGVQVVCSRGGWVITAYRNRDFRALRPHRRQRSFGTAA